MSANFSTNGLVAGMGSTPQSNTRRLLLLASLLTLGLWFVPYSDYVLYPLRLFITFIHESGHAMAAIISGGSVESLHVAPGGNGVTWTRDSPIWLWLTLSAGYLGTTIFGALMLQVGRFSRWQNAGRIALYIAGGWILLVTLLWAHNPFNNPSNSFTGGGFTPDFFTPAAGLLLAGGLLLLAYFSSPRVADFLAAFLAVQCSLNALGDLRILLQITTQNLGDNDAVFMSQHYLLPPTFWALLWAAMALIILSASLWSYLRATARAAERY